MANKGGNPENLVNLANRPPDERKRIARAGASASAEAKKKKKLMREQAELLLSLPVKDKDTVKKLKAMGFKKEDIDNSMLMMVSMHLLACSGGKGAVQAAQFLRDTSGQKPTDKISVEHDDGLLGDILQQLEDDGGDDE